MLSQFNDERCPGKLGGDDDATNVEELQSFSINFTFKEVPQDKIAKVLKAFILECMNKDTGVIFHPTNRQTLPKPISFSTKEKIPPTTARFLEFYHTIMTRHKKD